MNKTGRALHGLQNPHFLTASDGATIAYYVDDFSDPWDPGPPLYLMHSAMGHSGRFHGWMPGLARHFRVVRMDLRGHGRTPVPDPALPFTLARCVADVTDLMDHLGDKSAHMVANSAGGYVAQRMAIDHPERTTSLAIVGSTPGLSPDAAKWLPRIAAEGLRPFLADTIHMRFHLESTPKEQVEWFLDQTEQNDTPWVARFIGYMATQEWSADLPRIRCPSLVILPGEETVGGAHSYDAFRDLIPDVEMHSYAGMPHNIADMMPERCVSDILAFLSRRFGRPAP